MINVRDGDHAERSVGLVGVDRLGVVANLDHRVLLRGPPQPQGEERQVFTFYGPCQGTSQFAAGDEAAAPSSFSTQSTRAARPARMLTLMDAAAVRQVQGYFEVSGKISSTARGAFHEHDSNREMFEKTTEHTEAQADERSRENHEAVEVQGEAHPA
jgi:hypothetical protein